MKIGELAKRADTNVETVRYYEREGLLPKAKRTASNYRVYADEHLECLAFIRHCRSLDMTLDEIRTLLHFRESPTENCSEVNDLLDEHIVHVAQRISGLQKLKKHLLELRSLCMVNNPAENCGILKGLAASGTADLTLESHVSATHSALPAASKSGKRRQAMKLRP